MKHIVTTSSLLFAILVSQLCFSDEQRNILSFENGTVLLEYSSEYGGRASPKWIALGLIDGTPSLGWSSKKDQAAPHYFLFELPVLSQLDAFVFDTSQAELSKYQGIAAKEIVVSVATDTRTGPYRDILNTSIEAGKRDHKNLSSSVQARWVRVTINRNGGDPAYTELMEIEALGTPIGTAATLDISGGTFATNWNNFYLQIKNGEIRGCYDYDAGEFDGALDGRFLNVNWRENGNQSGKAVLAITRDGTFLNGFWYEKGELQGIWFGPRINDADEPECAAKLKVSKASKVERALNETGRAVLYGIRFDHDSATLKSESVAVLEQLLKWLIAHPSRNIKLAGHTDWDGSDAYNHDLSERRAAAVLAWFVGRSIATSRLSSNGYGESQPVADNASPQGRSLNRRVEVRVLN